MKHHKNPRDAASHAPRSQRQTRITVAFLPAARQQVPFSARRNSAPTFPAAPQLSSRYV